MKYAQHTSVSVDKSKTEIEKTLARYGAQKFMYGWDQEQAVICFHMNDRLIRFNLPMPDKGSRELTHTPAGRRRRNANSAHVAWEQACRQKWRALALVVKAKLEAVESDITTFEEEFLAHIVLPDGQTVGQFVLPQVEMAYERKEMPKLLPGVE